MPADKSARKKSPPPNPKPADQPRGAAVDEPRRKVGFLRRLFGLAALAAVLLVGALVARSYWLSGPLDIRNPEDREKLWKDLREGGREMADTSKERIAELRAEKERVGAWLKERDIELPKAEELWERAKQQLAAMAPAEKPPSSSPPQGLDSSRPYPDNGGVTSPTPTPPAPANPATPVNPSAPVTTAPPVQPRPEPTPVAPVPQTPRPVPTPTPAPVQTQPVTPAPAPTPAPAVVSANPELDEARRLYREGLQQFQNCRPGTSNQQANLRAAASSFRKAKDKLDQAARREPGNQEIQNLQVENNRFLYSCLKMQTL